MVDAERRRRSAVLGPTPKKRSIGSASVKACASSGRTTVRPAGLFVPDATLARNLPVATPAEADRPTSTRMVASTSRANAVAASTSSGADGAASPSRGPPIAWVTSR